ncbi:pseudouridine-5'-phosphatase-like isoform X3 [Gigantopelta aegis]|uniref:pseudouridine-5'-phosphatase-like isoform X3 n=1 Tax=Gigantopelta aegis TaxID=1735272 RepID=UPI001B88C896|nr:pseudouridine-5'-phosphatase-like isoform X3 [Gigantopelta aegis]
MSAHTPVTHVIFDMDGLLLDTERLYALTSEIVASVYGKSYTWEVQAKEMGCMQMVGAQIVIDALDLPLTPEEYINKCIEQYNILFPTVDLLPGAEKLIRHLHKHHIPMAIATGSTKYNYDLKTTKHKELFSVFDHVVLSSDDPEVKHGKPAPDCFLVCARRFRDSPAPEKVLVFEDAPNGVDAGHAAGMQVVWIPDERAELDGHKHKTAVILKSLEEFKPEEFGLPPYDS